MASLSLSLQKHPLPSLLPRQSPKPLSSSSHNLFILPKSSHSHFYGTVKLSYPPSLSLPSSNSSSRKKTLVFAKVNKGGVPPSFTLKDQEGRNVTLSKFKGKPVVVYFYPADETPGCTKQALCEKLVSQKSRQHCCASSPVSCWLHCLKDVKIALFAGTDKKALDCHSLLQALPTLTRHHHISFNFRW